MTRPTSLCETCAHVHIVRSPSGSVFLRCIKERSDPRFPKYPPQPVRACIGYARKS